MPRPTRADAVKAAQRHLEALTMDDPLYQEFRRHSTPETRKMADKFVLGSFMKCWDWRNSEAQREEAMT